MSEPNILELKMPNPNNKAHMVQSKTLGYSLDDAESEVSSIQIITEERNNSESIPGESNVVTSVCTPDDTMYSHVQVTGLYHSNFHYFLWLGSNILIVDDAKHKK